MVVCKSIIEMLPFQLVLISLKVYLSLSTIPITKYDNAQFIPDQGSDLITMLQLQTRDQCICQCSMNAVCTTVTYSGIDQSCSLYSSQFRREKLQLVTYDLNYVVFTLSNRMISSKYTFFEHHNSRYDSQIIFSTDFDINHKYINYNINNDLNKVNDHVNNINNK